MSIIEDINEIKDEILQTGDAQDRDMHLYFIKELIKFSNLNEISVGRHHNAIKLNSLLSRYNMNLENDDPVFFLKYQKTNELIKELAFGENKIINKSIDTDNWKYGDSRFFNNAGQHTKDIQENIIEIEIPDNVSVHVASQGDVTDLDIPSGKYLVKITGSNATRGFGGINCTDKNTGEDLNFHRGIRVKFAIQGYYEDRELKNLEFISNADTYFNSPKLFTFDMQINDDWIKKLIFEYRVDDKKEVIEQNLEPWKIDSSMDIELMLGAKKADRTTKIKLEALFSKQYLTNSEKVDLGVLDERFIKYFKSLDLETSCKILGHPNNRGNNECYKQISYNIDDKSNLDMLLPFHLKNCKEIKLGIYGIDFYSKYGNKYSKKVVKDGLMMAIKSYPNNLCQIKDYQTEKLCLAAVKLLGSSLRYVEDKTLNVCLEAVKNNIKALKYVPDEFQEFAKKEIENSKQKNKKSSKNKI
jgi:hypothetical protein